MPANAFYFVLAVSSRQLAMAPVQKPEVKEKFPNFAEIFLGPASGSLLPAISSSSSDMENKRGFPFHDY